MATLNGVTYKKNIVSSSKYSIKCPKPMKAKKITVHETDNMASAAGEISYMNGNNNQTSYHIAVDDKEAVQGLPLNRNGWHSGDGYNGYGNRNTIAVEICKNFDRNRGTRNLIEPLHSEYIQARLNAVKVIAMLCVTEGIVANTSNIKSHNDWNGKNCPSKMRQDGYWPTFVQAVINEYNRLKGNKSKPSSGVTKPVVTNPSTSKSSTTKWKKVSGSWTGQSLFKGQYGTPVKEMQTLLANNNPPFYPNKSAKNNGIDSYFGNDTKDQVERFQIYYGLQVDGIPGKEVYNKVKAGKKKAVPKKSAAPKSKPKTSKRTVTLPGSAKTWKTYKLNVQPVKKNSDWSLTPSRYGGITYEILGEPYPNVVTVKTSKGKRNIYVGPGTGAIIK